ncbi:MAG TPA: hypothetical protein VJ436_03395 [Anaerolineales bacterium]|nr:hypothetical protein [Anaerolineales bacterium]
MGRVINFEGVGKDRRVLTRAVVLALRELMLQTEPNKHTRDLAAFISMALEQISRTIDESVSAWEKRGYWIKADRFRMEWAWSERLGKAMRNALLNEDWPQVAAAAAEMGVKLNSIKLPQRHRLGTPWEGAWDKLRAKN